MVSDADRTAAVEFLYREARLADEARYADWLALWTDDGVYWVPATTDPAAGPDTHISHVYDNRARIDTRIKLLQTGHRYSQEPASLMRRLAIASVLAIAIWLVNFYGILSWLQPLLFGGEFQALQILECDVEFGLGDGAFALDVLERGAQILAAHLDGAQKRRKGETPDIGIAGALALAHHAVFEIGKFALGVELHAVERGHLALHLVDAEAFEPQQRIASFHDPSPFAAMPAARSSQAGDSIR